MTATQAAAVELAVQIIRLKLAEAAEQSETAQVTFSCDIKAGIVRPRVRISVTETVDAAVALVV